MGCHFLLQEIFLTQGSNPCVLHLLHWQEDFVFYQWTTWESHSQKQSLLDPVGSVKAEVHEHLPGHPEAVTHANSAILAEIADCTSVSQRPEVEGPSFFGVPVETIFPSFLQFTYIVPFYSPFPALVDGILQARILVWVAVPFSRGSSQPRDWTQVSHIAGRFFTRELQGKPENAGLGSLSLLQWIFLTQESNWGLLHCRWILYQLNYQGSPWWWETALKQLCVLIMLWIWLVSGHSEDIQSTKNQLCLHSVKINLVSFINTYLLVFLL